MKKEIFDSIIIDLKNLLKHHGINQMRIIIDDLCRKYSIHQIDYDTMYSLVSYEYRKKRKNENINLDLIINEWNDETNLTELAQKYNIPAFLLLKHLLNKITTKEISKKWLKNPNLCEDGKLAYEIMSIHLNDIMASSYHNQICLNKGIAFENEICNLLRQNHISFMSEEELRIKNFDVTPDFRLNLPLLLMKNSNDSSMTLFRYDKNDISTLDQNETIIITWIECKASFASIECHIEYYQNQYYSYINRFGDGLVLYKHGFVDNIPDCYKHNLVLSQQMPPFGRSR